MKKKINLSKSTDALTFSISDSPTSSETPNKKISSSTTGESIKTFCRIRPINGQNDLFKPSPTNPKLLLIQSEHFKKLNINPTLNLVTSYTFSKVFDEKSTQDEVFEYTCKQIVLDLLQKSKSGLIFTYGMTNAGKTFTVTGSPSSPGILPLSLQFLLENANEIKYKDFVIYCNFVEIYQEDVYDLLSNDPNAKNKYYKKKIDVKQNNRNLFYLQDVTNIQLKSIDDFNNVLNKGIAKKVHAATNLNQNSSRSHTIFKILLRERDLCYDDPNIISPSLSIVDLAGSERANRTEAAGKELQEACKINQSLSVLGKCLEAMKHNSVYTQKKIVPFRESKLTKIFCEYFQGEENIIMITNINPSKEDFEETVRALNYSCIAREIKPIKSRIVNNSYNYYPMNKKTVRSMNENEKSNNKVNNMSLGDDYSNSNDDNISSYDGIPNEFLINIEDDMQREEDDINISNNNKNMNKDSNSLTIANQCSSSNNEIAKLIFEIQKLRHEVENFKSANDEGDKRENDKYQESRCDNSYSNSNIIKKEVPLLPQPEKVSMDEIMRNPTNAINLIPPQNRNQGVNFIFINSRFSDFHMGKNGTILEEDEDDENENSEEEKKPKKKKIYPQKNKKQKKKQKEKKKSRKNKKKNEEDIKVKYNEDNMENIVTPIKDNNKKLDIYHNNSQEKEVISSKIETNETEKDKDKEKKDSDKLEHFSRTQPRNSNILKELIF